MDVSSIKTHAYLISNTNSGTLLGGDSNVLAALNIAYGHRILDILRVSVDPNASLTEATATLKSTVGLNVGDTGYNGEYSFPDDLLKPKRVELSYDGITYVRASFYDNGENLGSEFKDSQLAADFSEQNPQVDFFRDSFKIRPPKTTAGDILEGIYIEYELRQDDLSTGSPTFEANLHDILSYDLVSLEYLKNPTKHSQEWYNAFQIEKMKIEQRFFEFYKNRFKRNSKILPNYGSTALSYN